MTRWFWIWRCEINYIFRLCSRICSSSFCLGYGNCPSSMTFSSVSLKYMSLIDCSVFASSIKNSNSITGLFFNFLHNASLSSGISSAFAVVFAKFGYFMRIFVTSMRPYASVSFQNDIPKRQMPRTDMYIFLRMNIPKRLISAKRVKLLH